MKQTIHISDVLAFKRCRRYWNWVSPLREGLEPKTIYEPYFFGKMIHFAKEMQHSLHTPFDDAIDLFLSDYVAKHQISITDEPTIMQAATLARAVLSHYELWQATDPSPLADRHFEYLQLEYNFSTAMRTLNGRKSSRIDFAGIFDGVARNTIDGKLYLLEHKTTRSISDRLKQLDIEEQADAYLLAARDLFDEPIAGIVYTLIRKKAPEAPTQLKSGELSKAKHIDTSLEYYIWSLKQFYAQTMNGFTATANFKSFITTQYGDIISHLQQQENKFFRRVLITRNKHQLDQARNDLYATSLEMINPHVPIYRNGTNGCNYCTMREACVLLQQGYDITPILQKQYQRREVT